MATINQVKICKNCGKDISMLNSFDKAEGLLYCPYCRNSVEMASSKYFDSPKYLLHQKNSLLKELTANNIKPGDSKFNSESTAMTLALSEWARKCPDEDRLAALWDSISYLKEVLHSNSSPEGIRQMISLSKAVGKLGDSLETYFKSGGMTNDRKIRPVRTEFGESEWDQAAAAQGRDT